MEPASLASGSTRTNEGDLTDEEWMAMAPLLPGAARIGRRRSIDLREVLNATRSLLGRAASVGTAGPFPSLADSLLVVPALRAVPPAVSYRP